MGSSACFKGLNEGEELHVLAVDDSLIDRKCIEKLLKNSAYKVTTVESGLRALEYLGLGDEPASTIRTNHWSILTRESSNMAVGVHRWHSKGPKDLKINLIITDYSMPGMTGFELLKKIKESSAMKEIPVVVMSSENVPTRINMCLEQGAKEFMLKPLKQSDVKRLRCHIDDEFA